MAKYAEGTAVSSDRSRAEIERTLERYGATRFMYGWEERRAVIAFELNRRSYRVALPLPDRNRREFTHTPGRGLLRSKDEAQRAYEQAVRQRWRAFALWIKATLEAAEAGIATVEEAMQPWTMLPDGRTAGEWMEPQIKVVYETGEMPRLLPLLGSGETDQ